MEDTAVKELNAFLKGRYMGIHAYEHLIHNEPDPAVRRELQRIQQNHKADAARVAERIQNLGGVPVEGTGLVGNMAELMSSVRGFPNTTPEILESALKGEDDYGIRLSEEIVRGDLDPESLQMVEEVIDHGRQHVDTLKRLQLGVKAMH